MSNPGTDQALINAATVIRRVARRMNRRPSTREAMLLAADLLTAEGESRRIYGLRYPDGVTYSVADHHDDAADWAVDQEIGGPVYARIEVSTPVRSSGWFEVGE